MKKTLSLFAGALFWIFPATAQIPEAQPLYPQGAPDNNGLPADKAVYAESHAEKIAEADYMLFRAIRPRQRARPSSSVREGLTWA